MQSDEPKTTESGSGGVELSPPGDSISISTTISPIVSTGTSTSTSGGSSATKPVVSYVSLPSKPVVKLDPSSSSAATVPTTSSATLSIGDRAPIRRPVSPMESLMGSPRRYGEGGSRTTSHLSSSDILRGSKSYK